VRTTCWLRCACAPCQSSSHQQVVSRDPQHWRTSKGLSRPMASCTRRRWPSETRFMRQAGFTSRTCISRARRAGSTPVTLLIMVSALMSPCEQSGAQPTKNSHDWPQGRVTRCRRRVGFETGLNCSSASVYADQRTVQAATTDLLLCETGKRSPLQHAAPAAVWSSRQRRCRVPRCRRCRTAARWT